MGFFSKKKATQSFSCVRCGKTFVSREALQVHRAQCEEQEQNESSTQTELEINHGKSIRGNARTPGWTGDTDL